jgi:predicted RNA-binding Zn ribbon-like protein
VLTKHSTEFQFDLTGGQLALDLANTVSRRDDPERRKDHLENYLDVIAFARQTKLIGPKQAQELNAYAMEHAVEARRSCQKTIALREAVYRVFSRIAQSKPADPSDLQTISDGAREALRHRTLVAANGGYAWQWTAASKDPLDRVLWPMAQAAADLLTSDELRKVRLCEAGDCDWLFLDHSRNRSRRWCDMTTCGNRAKARRHYRRAHA